MRRLTILIVMIITQPVWAFFSLMDTTQLVRQGDYKILGDAQVLFDEPKGLNLNPRFSTGISDDSEVQFEAGVGSVDYYLGAFYKWVPIPDTDEQPGVGLRAGFTFANVNDYSTYGLNITPMISKSINGNAGRFTPYGGLQFGLQRNTNDTYFSMQATIGIEWAPNSWDYDKLKDFNFLVEYGFEVDDAFDYLSFGAAYNF